MYNFQKAGIMYKKIFTNVLLFIFLSSCSSDKTTPAFPTEPTRITTTISPTFQPISTREPINTPNNGDKIIQATNQSFNELMIAFPDTCKELSSGGLLISPDENWLAGECKHSGLQIINRDGSRIVDITYTDLFPDYHGSIHIHPIHWAKDSQHLYFSAKVCCWDPLVPLLSEITTLYKLGTQDGQYELVRKGLFDVSFAPQDQYLVFIEELTSPLTVEIQDLTQGAIRKATLDINQIYDQGRVEGWSARTGSGFREVKPPVCPSSPFWVLLIV
jgi:hypothetical protein